jgi:hypothetical protein
MAWPQATDYYEAIQNPGIAFKDQELRSGQPAVNALGMPMPCSGNFADVYQVAGADQQQNWAVKCFTREVPDRERRFASISHHLERRHLPFMVDFRYLADGILIRGLWYPVLKMRWIEGHTLNEFIRHSLGKPQMLLGLARIWRRLAHELREAGIAHGDLQHGNVLLIESRAGKLGVKLIDYDGMYIPALATIRSGEVGHPNYQHPQRLRDGIYDFEMDRFAHLVIYLALRALAVSGQPLWDRYDNGDNLLFREADLAEPANSSLFRELLRSPDGNVSALAGRLLLAAKGDICDVPLLSEVVNDNDFAVPLSNNQTRELQQHLARGGPTRPLPNAFRSGTPDSPPLASPVPADTIVPPPVRRPAAAVAAAPVVAPTPVAVAVPRPIRPRPRPTPGPQKLSPMVWLLAVVMPLAVVTLFVVLAFVFMRENVTPAPDLAEQPGTGQSRPSYVPPVGQGLNSGPPNIPNRRPASATKGGQLVATFDHRITDGSRPARIRSVLFLENGRHGASLGEDGSIRFWDLQAGKEYMPALLGYNRSRAYYCLALSPLGDRLVVGHTAGLTELGLKNYRKLSLDYDQVTLAAVTHAAYLGNGSEAERFVLVGGPSTLERWSLDRKARAEQYDTSRIGHAPFVITLAGELVILRTVAGSNGALEALVVYRLSDMSEVKRLPPVPSGTAHLAMDNAGHRVAGAAPNRPLTVWDLRKETFTQYGTSDATTAMNAVAMNGAGTRVVTLGDSGTLWIWDLADNGKQRVLGELSGPARAVTFAPDGLHILTGSDDGTVRLWRLDN